MTVTIKVPETTRDRLHRLAAAHGLTLAQQIERLLTGPAAQQKPAVADYPDGWPLSAEDIDAELARRFGL
ncbi:hypothetical protein [Nocardia sp. alder85J]|uniref:hypothetical protein n=1 Tax=Nocardia sp. alder85J TaxID=2862949 RepID=UPI001CD7AF29|nr:hypothetical protein [Nocardia sp. alder85J]MCX4093501.1 hypothetical protein [Nocardia sp. alder85J]